MTASLLIDAWRLTDDVAREEVLSVDVVILARAVFLHHHSAEVFSEQLSVGGQVEPEMPEKPCAQTEWVSSLKTGLAQSSFCGEKKRKYHIIYIYGFRLTYSGHIALQQYSESMVSLLIKLYHINHHETMIIF